MIGVRLGEPFLGATQPGPVTIPVYANFEITVSPGIGHKDGKVTGYGFEHECEDIAECAVIAGALLERLKQQGYPLSRQASPPANHLLEWQLQHPSLWLLLRVFRVNETSPWLLGFQVMPQEP